jgi:beta-glucanase (GH16 family)
MCCWRGAALLLLACAALPGAEWRLVWADEFDRPGRPDPAKWTYEEGFVRNHESQLYTRRAENARVENGVLVLEARHERLANPRYRAGAADWQRSGEFTEYTSASLTTEGLASWRSGRVEVRAKLPAARGTWPAIWMLGVNHPRVGWPLCGEIDILEAVGYDPGVVHANIHTATYNHAQKTGKGASRKVEDLYGTFHVYALEWNAERLDFFVDDAKYFSYANEKTGTAVWPYDQPFYLILNLAIGGEWGGKRGIDERAFPQRMEVDYVRIYQR